MRAPPSLTVLILACACSGSVAHTETAKPAPKPQPAQAPPVAAAAEPVAAAPAAAAPAPTPEPGVPSETGPAATAPPAPAATAPARIEGGDIPRPILMAVLSRGIGRFLQHVRAEAHLVRGRFIGWRLLGLFEGDPDVQSRALLPGDTVMRVNGQSIERPEQFKNVWDSLATQSELTLLVQRDGKPAHVHYRIVDPR